MEVLIAFLIATGLMGLSIATGFLLSNVVISISNILNKTIFKQRNYNKTLERVKYSLGYNQEMARFYKGEIDKLSLQYENEMGMWHCFKSWDYLKEIGIDEKLIEEGIKSEEEAMNSYETYSERKRREDIESRIQFIEKELKDIKRRV